MTGLERAYRGLLLAYPGCYRRERGEEIVETALAATPGGQRWPSLRDARALIVGGMRVRAGQNGRLATGAGLRLAVLLGVALWLAGRASDDLASAGQSWLHWVPPGQHAAYTALRGLMILAAVGAAWFAPRPIVAAISLIAAAACAFPWQGPWSLLGEPSMLVALALLAQGKDRPPRYWLWLPGIDLVALTLTSFTEWRFHPLFFLYPWLADLQWIALVAVVLWAVVDARPAIAVGVAIALGRAIPFVTGWYNNSFGHLFFWPLALGAALALAATLRLRRQAAL